MMMMTGGSGEADDATVPGPSVRVVVGGGGDGDEDHANVSPRSTLDGC